MPDDGGKELFFHISGVVGEFEPAAGHEVEFIVGIDRDWRPKAESIAIVSS